jgi:hypothetical protein
MQIEELEKRELLSTVEVSTSAQLAAAVAAAEPGTQIDLAAGTYGGFQLAAGGTAAAPIVVKGTSGTVISGSPADSNGEIDLTGCSYVTLENLDVEMNNSTATRAGIWGGGYAGANVNGITIQNCTVEHADYWDILFGFTNNSSFLDNTLNGTLVQHDLYVGNSSSDDVISGNLLENARYCGLEINEDGTQGGSGTGGGFVVDGNTFFNDAQAGGASINFDGVQNSTIENNLIYAGQRNGIALYQINGNAPSTGNVIVNNTIDINSAGPAGYAAISLLDGSADTTIYNNILSSAENSLSIDPASQAGLTSDYNIFGASGIDPTGQSYANNISLSAWQAQGHDAHSIYVGTGIAGLFSGAAPRNFSLAAGSVAIGAGTTADAPGADIAGAIREAPISIGAYQYEGSVSQLPPPVIVPPTISVSGPTSGTAGSSLTFTISSNDATDDLLSSLTIDWGDGTTSTEKVTETLDDGVYTASATFSHAYSSAGVYAVTAAGSGSLGTTASGNSIAVTIDSQTTARHRRWWGWGY